MIQKDLHNNRVIAGCMRIKNLPADGVENYVKNVMDLGVNFFDHADIYGQGDCQKLFGNVIAKNPSIRDKMIIQTKCGIVSGKMYDLSKKHIIESVENSLKDLCTDHIDYLLLHRSDALVEPEEVAEAFDILHQSGKVINFGVSNHTPYQIELLKKYVSQPLVINQLQLSVINCSMIRQGIQTNTYFDGAADRDGGILDYCRLNGIAIQAWSPIQYAYYNDDTRGIFIDNDKFPKLNSVLQELADKYNTTKSTIASAWILRHPAKMQIISGATSVNHFREVVDAQRINLTREEWYKIYMSEHILP